MKFSLPPESHRKRLFSPSTELVNKSSGVDVVILDEIDFMPKIVTRRKRHRTLIKGSTHKEDLIIINVGTKQ